LNAGFKKCPVSRLDTAGQTDSAAGIFDDDAFEIEGNPINGRVADAEIVGETAQEKAFDATLPEVAGKPCRSSVVVFQKSRVGIDVPAEAFANDELGVG